MQSWEPHLSPLHWSLSGPLDAIEEMVVRAPMRTEESSLEETIKEAKQAIIQYLFRVSLILIILRGYKALIADGF